MMIPIVSIISSKVSFDFFYVKLYTILCGHSKIAHCSPTTKFFTPIIDLLALDYMRIEAG